MDETYRTKLRHWLTSMLLLAVFGLISACYEWLVVLTPNLPNEDWQFDWVIYFLGNYLVSLSGLFLLLVIWHLSDFVQYGCAQSRGAKVLDRYISLVCAGCALGGATLLMQVPFLDELGCVIPQQATPRSAFDAPPNYFGNCGYGTPQWKYASVTAALLAFVVLCFGKAVYSLASQVRRFRPA